MGYKMDDFFLWSVFMGIYQGHEWFSSIFFTDVNATSRVKEEEIAAKLQRYGFFSFYCSKIERKLYIRVRCRKLELGPCWFSKIIACCREILFSLQAVNNRALSIIGTNTLQDIIKYAIMQ